MDDYGDYPMGDQDSHKKHVRHLNALKRGKATKEKNAMAKAIKSKIGDNFGARVDHYEKNVKPKYK